jgi:transcriptional regulator with AAA-type ATPase domain
MHPDLKDIIPISSSAVPRKVPSSTLISSNPGLRSVWRAVQLVARTDSSILIHGETGTGKELVRSSSPFGAKFLCFDGIRRVYDQ